MKLWSHQERAIDQVNSSRDDHVCVVAPPGAGKSLVMQRLAEQYANEGKKVRILVERSWLLDQLVGVFRKEGLDVGVRAAGKPMDPDAPIQIAMRQTEASRLYRVDWENFFPDIELVDEAHKQTGPQSMELFEYTGAKRVGFTASPVDMGNCYDGLINGGSYSEMRECQAHQVVKCWAPTHPDEVKMALKKNKSGEYSSKAVDSYMARDVIVGSVVDHLYQYNPDLLPSLLWAPSVETSKWFARYLCGNGIMAAHIDGDDLWMPRKKKDPEKGTTYIVLDIYDNTTATRQELMQASRFGEVKVICNRFVLREAIDLPWIKHGILATIIGALSSYLQTVGRLQRFWDAYDFKTLQDHGGNYDRHLSPNMDRHWEIGDTNQAKAKEIKRKKENTKDGDEDNPPEPICCPKCCGMRTRGKRCPHCNHKHARSVRRVIMADGALVEKRGRKVKYKKPEDWDQIFKSALFARYYVENGTVGQAVGYAIKLAREKNIDIPADRIDYNDPRWTQTVREAFPWAKPKHITPN